MPVVREGVGLGHHENEQAVDEQKVDGEARRGGGEEEADVRKCSSWIILLPDGIGNEGEDGDGSDGEDPVDHLEQNLRGGVEL